MQTRFISAKDIDWYILDVLKEWFIKLKFFKLKLIVKIKKLKLQGSDCTKAIDIYIYWMF